MILLDLWEEAYKKYTNNLPKGKTKSKSTPSKPVFIPDVQRDRILTEYIRDAKRKYLNDLRSYYESKIRLVSLAAESFLSTQGPSQKFSNQTPPRMVFKPRIDDIFKLIEKAFSLYIIYYETFSLSPLGVIPICIRETNPLAISAYSFESSILSAFIPKIFKGLCRSSWSSLSPTRSRA